MKTRKGNFWRMIWLRNIPYTRDTAIKGIEEIRKRTDASTNYPEGFDYLDFDPSKYDNEFNREVRIPQYGVLNDPHYYEQVPFLTVTDELLSAIKEGLISKLVFISASPNGPDSRKRKKFNKTLAKFPNTELILVEHGLFKKKRKYRWEVIKESHPDFDIFIDDSPTIINQSQENLPADKIFVTPDYKLNKPFINNKSNIYPFKINLVI